MTAAPPAPPKGFDLSAFGFDLNSRECATLLWLAVLLVWVVSRREIREHLISLIQIVVGGKLLTLFAVMSLYVAGMVGALWAAGAWAATNLKTTLVWWITVGFSAVSKALEIPKDPKAVGRMAAEAIAWTEVIVFVSEVHTLPLWGELLLLPALTLLAMLLVVAKGRVEHAIIVGPLTKLQVWAGLGIIGFSVLGILRGPADFLTWNNLREFLDPIILSLAFIPFLLVLAIVMTVESETTSLKLRKLDPGLVTYARRRSLLAFGLDFDGVRRLTRDIKLRDISDRAGVDAAIAEIKAVRRNARRPPPIDPTRGWSPFLAAAALNGEGLRPGDYHRAFGAWSAQAESLKIGEGFNRPSVSYSVSGDAEVVTRLRLQLTVNYLVPSDDLDAAWCQLAQALVGWALGPAAVDLATPSLLTQHKQMIIIDGAVVSLDWMSWGQGKQGGFDRILAINHPALVEQVYED